MKNREILPIFRLGLPYWQPSDNNRLQKHCVGPLRADKTTSKSVHWQIILGCARTFSHIFAKSLCLACRINQVFTYWKKLLYFLYFRKAFRFSNEMLIVKGGDAQNARNLGIPGGYRGMAKTLK